MYLTAENRTKRAATYLSTGFHLDMIFLSALSGTGSRIIFAEIAKWLATDISFTDTSRLGAGGLA